MNRFRRSKKKDRQTERERKKERKQKNKTMEEKAQFWLHDEKKDHTDKFDHSGPDLTYSTGEKRSAF